MYCENAKIAATFWEWRHKVMTHFFASFAAIVVVAGWFYKELRPWLPLPFVLGAGYSVAVVLMDRVNKRMLTDCYSVGTKIEEMLGSPDGPYTRIAHRQTRAHLHYHEILRWVYIAGAVLLFIAACLAFGFVR
jgi:hypothetical protein